MTRPFESLQSTDVRDCRLYRFWVAHPITGERVLGYVGETAREPLVRLMEHILSQPWADTILAWAVDDRIFAGKEAVLAAEKAAVEQERPLYPVEWNSGNPHRISRAEAIRQRHVRDDAAVRPRWQPQQGSYRPPGRRASDYAAPASAAVRWADRPRFWPTIYCSAWLLLVVYLWRQLAELGAGPAWGISLATVAAAFLLWWGREWRPKRRRRYRRRIRR